MTDEEVARNAFNVFSMNALPNLLSDDIEDAVTFKSDTTFYKYLMPNLSQISNFFYSKNVIELKDNVLDVFELNER